MEVVCSLFVLIVIFGSLIFGLGRLFWSRNDEALERAFRQLARRYHGRVETNGWYQGSHPNVKFQYRDLPLVLESYSENGQQHVALTLPWREAFCGCALTSREFGIEQFVRGHRTTPTTLALSSSNTRGDVCYVVGFQPERLQQIASTGVLRQMGRLFDWNGGRAVAAIVAPPRLIIHQRGVVSDFDRLFEFVRLGIELFEQMRATEAHGLSFVDDGMAHVIERAECQVCGESILQDLVVCRRCQTPHHRDCWEYTGGCSIYGCGEQRYDVV